MLDGRWWRRGGGAPEPQPLGVGLRLARLEIADQLLDLLAVRRVGRELEVLPVAEDGSVVVAEVAVALADVEQEVGERLGVERPLVLVDRLAEPGERIELLAALEVELGGARSEEHTSE